MKTLDQKLQEIDIRIEKAFLQLSKCKPEKFEFYFTRAAELCKKRIDLILK